MKTNIKTLVISLSLIASANAFAGLGGVNVQSNLGEPFSGSIVVTGKEAETLINNRNVSVSGSGISGTVIPQSNGTAIVRLRSNNIINEPIIHFAVSAGNQQRHYSVAISPTSYANSLKSTTSKNQVQTDEIKGKHSQPTTRSTQTVRGKPNHRVQKEETVSILADRYRPRNMTHAQAVQAIVEANPQIFNARSDGSLLYKGIDIYIPFKSSRYVAGSPTASTKNTVVKYGKPNHYVQEGETVSILADRYRPQNMTHAQAVQAIIAANPRVFKGRADGSLLYKDINIYIPFKSSDANGTPNASTENNTPATPQTQTQTNTPAGNTVPATAVQPEPVSTPEPTPAAPKNTETTTPAEQTASVASKPASTASEVAASEPKTETTSTPEASEASSVANAPQPEPVVTPTESAQPKPTPEPESSSDIPWGLLGLGGAALLGLGGLGYALYRRKNAADDDDNDETWEDDEDDFVEEKDEVTVTAAPTSPVQVQEEIISEPVPTQPVVDDFVVDIPVADTQHQVATENVEFNDTLFTEDFSDDFTSKTQSVVDTIKDTTFDLGNVAKTAAVAGAAATVSAATNAQQEVVETYDDWLEDFSITDETAQPQQAAQQTEPAVADSDSWLNDFAELDTPANHTNVETVVAEETPAIDSALNFVVTDTIDEKPIAPAVSNEQKQENDNSDLDVLNFVLKDEPEVSSTKPEPVVVQEESAGTPTSIVDEAYSALSLNKETEVVSAKQSAVHSNVSTDSIRDEWFDAPSTPNSNEAAGFVSESIGMAAPLEAKLELAKMYLEIDDAVAARETLRELVNEATGEIQEAAQKLLAELGN